ncbi:alpha/beta fold hydrolase [Roseovarius sp. SCSIO 43702]|uniref:alpha/beta fold hydrolase n=1 Tax=Roseovarius sp. SCSIO 43702 TaxID=2823043 RepID=UPI001C7389E1|nr:alpha/beta fold hydrolase [Roseovarius sp. SCSIO 43702]QYX56372.1 alpha/beta fold hydrolase [Roseovarius sp. SCSIO 43702]
MLNTITHGQPTGRTGLLIAHGLYGSARNWGVIAKRLADTRQVTAVDMRNHGDSPGTETHSYPEMAHDLAEVIEAGAVPRHVMGHSMGGKAAMLLALERPDLVQSLIVADIAPVAYAHSQKGYAEAMRDTDLAGIERRSDAAERLMPRVDNPDLVPFFLQSLDVKERRWKLNLDTLISEMPKIMDFPDVSGSYAGPTLFLTGATSDYVTRAHRDRITALFPAARFVSIPEAGHWLHAEKPREFEAAVRAWLDRQDTRATT